MDSKSKILIVDDTVDTVELLEKRFRSEGYDTISAYDGEEGLRMAGECHPDIIVLDVMMPKMDGFEVCEQLKADEETKYIPILMLTAKSELPSKIKGFDAGVDGYMTKPFEYKELAARIRSLLEKKIASNKLLVEGKIEALDQMLDEVAHEVRNPLVAIGGFARRVHKNLPEGSVNRRYMEIILDNVAAMEKMVQQLFEVKSATVSYIESCDINDIIHAALDMFDQEINENNITVKTRLRTPAPSIAADCGNITRAIACLIENAIEAMQGETRDLTIITRGDNGNGNVVIELADTGKGIPRETMKSIYDPFFTSKIYGPGLGLTFVLKTIQNHKGSITVESEEGVGACFTVKLPLHPRRQ